MSKNASELTQGKSSTTVEAQPDIEVKMLLFGVPGVGKTTFLGSAVGDARLMPALLLDFEAGTLAITSKIRKLTSLSDVFEKCKSENRSADYLIDVEKMCASASQSKIDVIRIVSSDDLKDILDLFREKKLPYKTLLVDSLTEINYQNLREVTQAASAKDFKADPELPKLQDYAKSAVQMRGLIRQFRDLPINIVFTALPNDVKDDMNGSVTTKPSLTGKLADEVAGMLDIVGYVDPINPVADEATGEILTRAVFFQPTRRFRAKDRTEGAKLGDSLMLSPSMPFLPLVIDLITGKKTKEEPKVAPTPVTPGTQNRRE